MVNILVVEDDVKISVSEYIIYEIELQTEENVLYGDYINGHSIYKSVVENSNNEYKIQQE